jgi:hypothetical protein
LRIVAFALLFAAPEVAPAIDLPEAIDAKEVAPGDEMLEVASPPDVGSALAPDLGVSPIAETADVDPVLDVPPEPAEREPEIDTDTDAAVAPPMPIEEPVAAPPAPPSERPLVVVKTLLGLLLLVVLAYLGGHPRIRALEAKLGISRVVAAGFPFLLLGLIAASEPVGVLSPAVIDHMRPLLHLALGWLGLAVGLRVELGRMSALPRGTPAILALGTGLPFLMITAGGGVLLLLERAYRGESPFDMALVRNALVLGTAGAMAADTDALRVAMRKVGDLARDRISLIARLDETIGLVGLIFLTAYVRPGSSWEIPGTAWLFITLGLPACAGFVVYLGLRIRTSSTELVALLLGFVAFVAGIASTLLLSALVVCFVVGVLLANFPGEYHERLRDVLGRLEAPIYLLFLLVAGANWKPWAVLGWALVLVLLLARLPGRWLGARLAWRRTDIDLPPDARPALVFSPLGTLPIAIAVNAELLYPEDPTLPAIVTAVIGATIMLEFFAQLYWRAPPEAPR